MSSDYLSIAPNLTQDRNPFNYEKVEQVSRDFTTSWLTEEQIKQQLKNLQTIIFNAVNAIATTVIVL